MNSRQALQTFGRSGNPMFSDKTFNETIIDVDIPKMTLQGTVNKVGISLILVLISAAYTWNQYFTYGPSSIPFPSIKYRFHVCGAALPVPDH